MGRPTKAEIAARNAANADNAEVEGSEAAEMQETASPVLAIAKPHGSLVKVTITKFGDGKVSKGVHVAGQGDVFAARGDTLMVSSDVAKSLEALGIAEAD